MNEKIQELTEYLDNVGLPEYTNMLVEEQISLEILGKMSHEDLRSIGVHSFGHRFRLQEGLQVMNAKVNIVEEYVLNVVSEVIDQEQQKILN